MEVSLRFRDKMDIFSSQNFQMFSTQNFQMFSTQNFQIVSSQNFHIFLSQNLQFFRHTISKFDPSLILKFQPKFQKLHKAVMEYEVLPFLLCDAFHSALVYFYFSRYIIPGREVSGGGYITAILVLVKVVPGVLVKICTFLRWIFNDINLTV